MPLYEQVMSWLPTVRSDRDNDTAVPPATAVPSASGTLPNRRSPSAKVTWPYGATTPPTVAVITTGWPKTAGFADDAAVSSAGGPGGPRLASSSVSA